MLPRRSQREEDGHERTLQTPCPAPVRRRLSPAHRRGRKGARPRPLRRRHDLRAQLPRSAPCAGAAQPLSPRQDQAPRHHQGRGAAGRQGHPDLPGPGGRAPQADQRRLDRRGRHGQLRQDDVAQIPRPPRAGRLRRPGPATRWASRSPRRASRSRSRRCGWSRSSGSSCPSCSIRSRRCSPARRSSTRRSPSTTCSRPIRSAVRMSS